MSYFGALILMYIKWYKIIRKLTPEQAKRTEGCNEQSSNPEWLLPCGTFHLLGTTYVIPSAPLASHWAFKGSFGVGAERKWNPSGCFAQPQVCTEQPMVAPPTRFASEGAIRGKGLLCISNKWNRRLFGLQVRIEGLCACKAKGWLSEAHWSQKSAWSINSKNYFSDFNESALEIASSISPTK